MSAISSHMDSFAREFQGDMIEGINWFAGTDYLYVWWQNGPEDQSILAGLREDAYRLPQVVCHGYGQSEKRSDRFPDLEELS